MRGAVLRPVAMRALVPERLRQALRRFLQLGAKATGIQ